MSTESFEQIAVRLRSDPTFMDYFLKEAIKHGKELKLLHPLYEAGFFMPNELLRPQKKEDGYTIPWWDVSEFLVQAAKINNSKPNAEITSDLKRIVTEMLQFNFDGVRNFQIDTALAEVIFRLPLEDISNEYIDALRVFLENGWRQTPLGLTLSNLILPVLIGANAKDKLLRVLGIFLDYSRTLFEKDHSVTSIIDEYWFSETLNKNKDGIYRVCGIDAAHVGIKIIQELYDLDEAEFNIVWVPSIEMSSQTMFEEKYDYQLVSFVRDIILKDNSNAVQSVVKTLLSSEIPVLRRIAYHVIDERYEEFSPILWNGDFNPFADKHSTHEIMRLLGKNSNRFTREQLTTLAGHIEEHKFHDGEVETEDDRIYVAYKKKSWYSLLLPSGDDSVKAKYDEYNSVYSNPITEADSFSVYVGSLERKGSPVDDLSIMTDDVMIEYLKQEGGGDAFEPSGKLRKADALTAIVKSSSDRFITGYAKFIDLNVAFHYGIVRGVNESLQDGGRINWADFIKYLNTLFTHGREFGEQAKGYNFTNWLIGEVAGAFKFGSNNEELGYPFDLLPDVEELLLALFDFADNDFHYMRDMVTSVLNSTYGKLYAALMVCSLRYFREFKERADYPGWRPKVKEKFVVAIETPVFYPPDARIILAEYLPQLFFHLDKEFITTRIDHIFLTQDNEAWQEVFGAYLVTSNIFVELFQFLNRQGFYTRALKNVNDRNARERLIGHVVVSYLNGLDEKRNPLIESVLESRNYQDFSRITHFIAWNNLSEVEGYGAKVLDLWKKINDIQEKENNPDKDFYDAKGRLLLWFKHFSLPDTEVQTQLQKTIAGMKDDFTISRFLELLVKYIDEDIRDVLDIFKYFFQQGIYPHYPDKNITIIFEGALKQGYIEDAREILNRYTSKNIYGLKTIWDKYQLQ